MQLWESVKELQFLCERLDFIHIYSRHNARYTWWTRNFSRTSEKVAAWQIRRLAARGVRRFTARFDDKTRRQLVSPVDCQSVCLPFPVGVCLSVSLSFGFCVITLVVVHSVTVWGSNSRRQMWRCGVDCGRYVLITKANSHWQCNAKCTEIKTQTTDKFKASPKHIFCRKTET